MVAVALAAAGGLTFAAAWERWWPSCPRGAFDSAACVRVQSHELDYLVPSAPWEPAGHAALYAGGALLALAVAALWLPQVVHPTGGSRRPAGALLGIVPAGALTLLGVTTLRSGVTGEPASASGLLAAGFVVWAVAWPAALMAYAVLAPGGPRGPGVSVAALVGLSTPVPVMLFLGPIAAGHTSYDTAPWTEATAAPLLLTAAVVVLCTPLRRPAARSATRLRGRRHTAGLAA